ncbi:EutN/CcmL family microcompartment protein [bacterium]|nr:EutN/CcmL family microcompartment protein [bacterium]
MFLGVVRGTVVASQKDPGLEGAMLRIVQPVNHDRSPAGTLLVAVDGHASREGDLVYLVKGKEACIPWKKSSLAPIDAAIVGLVEGMSV